MWMDWKCSPIFKHQILPLQHEVWSYLIDRQRSYDDSIESSSLGWYVRHLSDCASCFECFNIEVNHLFMRWICTMIINTPLKMVCKIIESTYLNSWSTYSQDLYSVDQSNKPFKSLIIRSRCRIGTSVIVIAVYLRSYPTYYLMYYEIADYLYPTCCVNRLHQWFIFTQSICNHDKIDCALGTWPSWRLTTGKYSCV